MKTILYCRKSTDSEDKQVMSLDAQENELLAIAKREGLEIVEIYRESMSAKAPGRPKFAEMLGKISNGEADCILCWKIDRLTRNPVDGGSISWMLQSGQIKAIRTHEREYLPSDNVLLLYVELGMSNQYVRDLSENVKRGNREKVRRGEWPNRAPYGYKNDKNTKTLKIVRSQARLVNELFELYSTGRYSMRDMAKRYGVSVSQIELRLKRHVYYGMIEYHGDLFPGNHKPLISKELFDLAQSVRESVRVSPSRPQSLFFPYRGLMNCAVCGCKLTATRKKGQYDYYYCTNGKGGCDQHRNYLTEKSVQELVTAAINKLHFDEELIEIMYEAARERRENGKYDSTRILTDLKVQLEGFEASEKKLLRSYTRGLIDEHLYTEEVAELRKEKSVVETKYNNYQENAHTRLSTLELTKQFFLDSNKAVSEFKKAEPERKREIAENLLWNFSVKDKKVLEYKYKSPYQVIANAPKNGALTQLLPD